MKGLFIPDITAKMFRNACLEGIKALVVEGEFYDIEYSPWTPVSELPPEEEEVYLIQTDDGYMCNCRWTNRNHLLTDLTTDWHWHIMDVPQYSKVVAWMELPEPYREEKKVITLKMISTESDLRKETGLDCDGLCEAGFNLDDWDVCFVSEKSLVKWVTDEKGDLWDAPIKDAYWIVKRMENVGYTHIVYDDKYYYMVYYS